ncbi:MAG: hypothetical protein RR387_05355 [Clostridiales bacterium]
MRIYSWFLMKKHSLLAVAGIVWLLAGFNVARLGVIAYRELPNVTVMLLCLSLVVFCIFARMFYKMTDKHAQRIISYPQEKKPIWNFFDVKAYCIMTVMMGGGIWLRSSGLAPTVFIAVFYTGLGCALAMAGIVLEKYFLRSKSI